MDAIGKGAVWGLTPMENLMSKMPMPLHYFK